GRRRSFFPHIGMDAQLSIAPFHYVSWKKFPYAFHQRVWRRHVVKAEKAIQASHAEIAGKAGMGKDALQLRAEKKFAIVLRVIQRLDAHAIAGQNELPLRLYPDGDGKHSPQVRKALASPAQIGMQDDFSIATGLKA